MSPTCRVRRNEGRLVEKIPHSLCYRLLPTGYRICLVFLRAYGPMYKQPIQQSVLGVEDADVAVSSGPAVLGFDGP